MADHQRLDKAIEARRLDLGLSWIQLAKTAGISDVSLRNFRKGRGNPSALSKRRLETALQWGSGSIDAVLEGGDPLPATIAPNPLDRATAAELTEFIEDLRDEIRFLSVRHERNRPYLVAHLERQIAQVEERLNALRSGD